MNKDKIRILSLSWRDIKSPKMGGAEIHTFEMLRRNDMNKYHITMLTPYYYGLPKKEIIDGIEFIRKGNLVTVIFHAINYYIKNRKEIDFVIDQCNTHRFFTPFWVPRKKRIFYIHQLTKEIWDINVGFPMNYLGKLYENIMLKIQNKDYVITVSESTKRDLVDFGFDKNNIYIIPNCLDKEYLNKDVSFETNKDNVFIYVGRYSKYKGIDAAIKAFFEIKKRYKDSKFYIIGKRDEKVIDEIIKPLAEQNGISYGENEENDLILYGFASEEEKKELMEKSKALLFPSVREGWGIIVLEAGAMGTPSIVYNSPGCIDAVDYGRTGYLCEKNNHCELARLMFRTIENEKEYYEKRTAAYLFAQNFDWDKNSGMFDDAITDIIEKNKIN